jgi:RHS repeat-associated protein
MVGDPLGSSSAYWTSWGFGALGDRASQVAHATSGGTDTTTGYTYDGNGKGQPDTLTSTAASGGSTAAASYGFDSAGNMTSRSAGQGSQALSWDDAGRLTAITGSTSGNASYVYDAGGSLLLEKDPGATILYLPGEQVTLNTATQATTGIRYFGLPGGGTAYRTGSGNSYGYEISDQQGTNLLTLDYTAQLPAWRQQAPYGAPRGASVSWIDNRAFLDKPADAATGLDIVGARSYDPVTGRFASPDPVLGKTSPQQLNGYSYAAGNPVSSSDPTGAQPVCDGPCPRPRRRPRSAGVALVGKAPARPIRAAAAAAPAAHSQFTRDPASMTPAPPGTPAWDPPTLPFRAAGPGSGRASAASRSAPCAAAS